jgi:hypothetical protein
MAPAITAAYVLNMQDNHFAGQKSNFINETKRLIVKVGFILCTALFGTLTGHTTFAADVPVGVSVVAIHTEAISMSRSARTGGGRLLDHTDAVGFPAEWKLVGVPIATVTGSKPTLYPSELREQNR